MIVYQTRNGLIYLLSAIRICVHQSDSLILQLLAVNREEILCYGRCQHLSSAVQCNLVYECKDRRFHSLSVRHNGNYAVIGLFLAPIPASIIRRCRSISASTAINKNALIDSPASSAARWILALRHFGSLTLIAVCSVVIFSPQSFAPDIYTR